MTSAAGTIIYKAFAPTLKMMICIALGFIISKKGKFTPQGARGVSVLSLNIGLPALIFHSMVTSFSPTNISAFGSLALMAIVYEILGLLLAWVVRELVYVPQDFQWGILVMGTISNWGNLPVAVVQTLAASPPFDPSVDIGAGVAYISVFILIMNTCLFPLGLHKLCALDFKESNLLKDPAPPFKERWTGRIETVKHLLHRRGSESSQHTVVEEKDDGSQPAESPQIEKRISDTGSTHEEAGEEPSELRPADLKRKTSTYVGGAVPTRKKSRASSFSSMMESTRPIPPTAPLEATDISSPCIASSSTLPGEPAPLLPVCSNHGPTYDFHKPATPPPSIHKKSLPRRVLRLFKSFIMPVTLAICIGLPCSLILPIKALFVDVQGWTNTKIPDAPDGNPPLSFIVDTTAFLGGMTIPAGLILLGASIARLKTPKRWRDQPLAAIVAMTVVKMIIVPLFGVFVIQALRNNTGLYPQKDLIRTFVAILCSGTPAAINQLVVTQLYNPAGSADTLASFLALQYAVMPVLSTGLAAIALYVAER